MALKRPQRNQKKQMKPNQTVFFLGGKRKWMQKILEMTFTQIKKKQERKFLWLKIRTQKK